jgi:hypothetical protein
MNNMPITVTGDQTLTLVIGIFALIGFIRGWRKMGVVFVGTLLAGAVLIRDDARLIKTINNLPTIVDLLLDTKYGAAPPLIDATSRPYWMLTVLLISVVVSWILSNTLVQGKGPKVDWNRPAQALAHALTSVGVGAGTGYLIVVRGYEYLLALNTDQQKQIFQGFTILLQPLPKANVLVQYESLIFLALVLLAVGVIFGSKIFGSGYGRGKGEPKGSRD